MCVEPNLNRQTNVKVDEGDDVLAGVKRWWRCCKWAEEEEEKAGQMWAGDGQFIDGRWVDG